MRSVGDDPAILAGLDNWEFFFAGRCRDTVNMLRVFPQEIRPGCPSRHHQFRFRAGRVNGHRDGNIVIIYVAQVDLVDGPSRQTFRWCFLCCSARQEKGREHQEDEKKRKDTLHHQFAGNKDYEQRVTSSILP